MLMTVEEAKKIWCPHVRLVQSDISGAQISFNRVLEVDYKEGKRNKITEWNNPTGTQCLGNKCAAWRWKNNPEIAEIDLTTGDIEKRTGYCGLAGPVC